MPVTWGGTTGLSDCRVGKEGRHQACVKVEDGRC